MIKRWALCLILSTLSFAVNAVDETQMWLLIYNGKTQTPSVFVDLTSINKQGRSVSFVAMTQLPPFLRLGSFITESDETIALKEPAAFVVFKMSIDCKSQTYIPYTTDFLNEKRKLIYSHISSEDVDPIAINPRDDTVIMFKFFCGTKLKESQPV